LRLHKSVRVLVVDGGWWMVDGGWWMVVGMRKWRGYSGLISAAFLAGMVCQSRANLLMLFFCAVVPVVFYGCILVIDLEVRGGIWIPNSKF